MSVQEAIIFLVDFLPRAHANWCLITSLWGWRMLMHCVLICLKIRVWVWREVIGMELIFSGRTLSKEHQHTAALCVTVLCTLAASTIGTSQLCCTKLERHLTQGGVIWHLSHKSSFFHVGGGWQRQGHVGVKINKAWLWNLKWAAVCKGLILSWDVAGREREARKGSHKGNLKSPLLYSCLLLPR